MNVLVIVAHPDDEIIGCGGTMLKHLDKNDNVSIFVLSKGWNDYQNNDMYDLYNNKPEIKLYTSNFEDNKFDSHPLLDIIEEIEKCIFKVKPDIIYTHSSNDLNIDHRIVYQAVLTANRPCNKLYAEEIYSCEIASSTEWQFPNKFNPNVWIEIDIKGKINLMKYYGSQLKDYPHPRSLLGLENRSKYWGNIVLKRYCEVFELIRMVK